MNNKNKLIFRLATLDDKNALLKYEQAVVEAERPFNAVIKQNQAHYYDIEDLILNDNSCMLVVESNGMIIATGYCQIRESKKSLNHTHHGYLGFMYVSPEYRGQGINQKVIENLISWAKNKDIHDFYLDVYSENTAAIKAYQKLNFTPSLLEMKLNL